jgi:hypothetical protein
MLVEVNEAGAAAPAAAVFVKVNEAAAAAPAAEAVTL